MPVDLTITERTFEEGLEKIRERSFDGGRFHLMNNVTCRIARVDRTFWGFGLKQYTMIVIFSNSDIAEMINAKVFFDKYL